MAVVLDRHLSDHCLIVLKDEERNFGLKPLKIFDSWLDDYEVDNIITAAWNTSVQTKVRKDCTFRDKLKNVKNALRTWSKKFNCLDGEIEALKAVSNNLELKAKLHNLNNDEQPTSALFLNYLSRKPRLNLPFLIVEARRPRAPMASTCDSIKKKYWELIKADLISAIQWFWETGEFSKGCNASFVTLIPKKLDPLTLGDYRPISLIGSYYKVIAKILSNRLRRVIPSLVG
ncbi:uncharacterized protein [Rutidosis leptorrhynchoides]|uniref:uncharacterized protein n=1 Tax=Rutidosis leptorrhynchoides TaxID=125765 RepID=UPI003A99FE88